MEVVYTDEASDEIKKMLNQRQNFIDPKGGMSASCAVDTVSLVLKSMTGD